MMNSSRKFQNDLTANKPNGKDVVSSEVSGDPKSKKPNGKSVDSSAEPCSLVCSSNRRPGVLAFRRSGVRHSTFEPLPLGRSIQSIASGFLRFWDSLNFKKDKEFVGITILFVDEKVNSVVHGFTPVGRANHYMPSLKTCSIVKVDRFEVASHHGCSCDQSPVKIRLFDNLQVIANRNLNLSVLSGALTSPKKQLEQLFVSSLIHAYEEDEDDNQYQ
ncbi:hypothetical protein F2Q68_00011144 [Brassica cretica]|uniref:Uncharacterized protein n=1 Tax=Brassica cretica TaxID=69181 RepID=A0A8S9KMG0_BRACR|nr:hypothetical protein F2Q68_00011144 [Brassica cretica]